MSENHKPRYMRTEVPLHRGKLTLYVGQRVHTALTEVTADMDIYKGVRLGQVMEAVYEQGLKDGRRDIIEQFESKIRDKANYMPPGRPKNRKSKVIDVKPGSSKVIDVKPVK